MPLIRASYILFLSSILCQLSSPIFGQAVFIYDQPTDQTGDMTGQTDFDPVDARNLSIAWNADHTNATDWHIYVRKGLGGSKFLGRTADGNADRFDWYARAPNLSAEFANGPDFNSVYTFRVIRIDGQLGPDDYFDMTAPVGFNLEGGNPVSLAQSEIPNLNMGQISIYDDILGGNDLAPMNSNGVDNDRKESRAIQIAWNFGRDESTVNEYHVLVSVDGGAYQFLGQTYDGRINYYLWNDKNEFKTDPVFTNGPQDGHTYQFMVYLSPLSGNRANLTSGSLAYSVGNNTTVNQTPTPIPISTSTPISTPTFTPTNTTKPTVKPTMTFTPTATAVVLPESITVSLPGLPSSAKPLEMALIRAGNFTMGSPDNEQDRSSNEGPQHTVTLTRDFYLSKYEITQAQWESVMGSNPSTFQGNQDFPVETVTWYDCLAFIQNLNALGNGDFLLPTEAEWECACRARTASRFYWGNDPGHTAIGNYAWNWFNSGQTIQPVGQLLPNAWNLYDMSGNGQEWCLDLYGSYSSSEQTDPMGASEGENRVLRGGFWGGSNGGCRSAARQSEHPMFRSNTVSFRVVKVIPVQSTPTPADPDATPTPVHITQGPLFGSALQSFIGYSAVNTSLSDMQDDHLPIIRYFAHESFTDNINMALRASQQNMKIIMVFGCGYLEYGIDCNITPNDNAECWWNLDLLSHNEQTGAFVRRYTCDADGYADWIEYRLNQIEQAVPGAIGNTIIGIQLGNEEEGKWRNENGVIYEEGNTFYSGRIFADYYLAARDRIKSKWPNLDILSGSVESHRSLDFNLGGVASRWMGDNGKWARAFLNGMIQQIMERPDGGVQKLPDIIAVNGYPGIAPPEYLCQGEGTKEWIQRLTTLNTICRFYEYQPRFAQTECGFSPQTASVYGCENASELTQAVYYLRRALMDSAMRSDDGDFWTYSLYWVHHYNGNTQYDTGWFNNQSYIAGSSRPIRKVGRILHAETGETEFSPGIAEGMSVWLPAASVRGEENPVIGDNTMTCGWLNAQNEKWGAIWKYRNNTSAYYTAPAATAQFKVQGNNHGRIHLFKFQFNEPYGFDRTQWIQLTETPIAGRPDPENADYTIYDLPASIDHAQHGVVLVTNENPTFLKFGY
ncbi:MAG: formylglycine-generating enzyme family protein [Candidatus Omnitrophota bacterium]|jgi:formylglycine-generating enzyme required for sulfatase activity|nr:MAG: formylglycine-generating enzyme family protein [Candidatus Omnitrophota bacterium]